MNYKALVVMLLVGLFSFTNAAPQHSSKSGKPASKAGRHTVAEFKSLYVAQVEGLGYSAEELRKAASIQTVVARFGKPAKSEEAPVLGLERKVLYYPAIDEFGNRCLAALIFQAACGENKSPECYKLVEPVRTQSQ